MSPEIFNGFSDRSRTITSGFEENGTLEERPLLWVEAIMFAIANTYL